MKIAMTYFITPTRPLLTNIDHHEPWLTIINHGNPHENPMKSAEKKPGAGAQYLSAGRWEHQQQDLVGMPRVGRSWTILLDSLESLEGRSWNWFSLWENHRKTVGKSMGKALIFWKTLHRSWENMVVYWENHHVRTIYHKPPKNGNGL